MNSEDIRSMFVGITDDTREIIARKLKAELSQAILDVNKKMVADGTPSDHLCPPPALIMNAFRLCPLADARIVILGQDPYIGAGEAMGLSFSVPKGKSIPPSLRNVYECLKYHHIIKERPMHGDLTNWARQGVLMINAAFTTVLKKSNAHAECWAKYTDALLREISALPQQLIFILLGGFAQEKARMIDKRRHVVLEWGHPSPLNNANQSDNPKNFKYCNVFTRANDILTCRELAPINWDPDYVPGEPIRPMMAPSYEEIERVEDTTLPDPPVTANAANATYTLREAMQDDPAPLTTGTLWIFTDGGSKGNGRANCNSSWSFYMTDGCVCATAHGVVEEKDIPGEVYRSSNNRGELTAIQRALEYITANSGEFSFENVILVSDSEYSIKCLDVWAAQWLANPAKHKLSEKKNLDIIVPTKGLLDNLRTKCDFKLQHVNSHLPEPADHESEDWFLWRCNDIVDRNCGVALGR